MTGGVSQGSNLGPLKEGHGVRYRADGQVVKNHDSVLRRRYSGVGDWTDVVGGAATCGDGRGMRHTNHTRTEDGDKCREDRGDMARGRRPGKILPHSTRNGVEDRRRACAGKPAHSMSGSGTGQQVEVPSFPAVFAVAEHGGGTRETSAEPGRPDDKPTTRLYAGVFEFLYRALE